MELERVAKDLVEKAIRLVRLEAEAGIVKPLPSVLTTEGKEQRLA